MSNVDSDDYMYTTYSAVGYGTPIKGLLDSMKIGNKAVKEAQKDSLKKGIANVYSKNKRLYFQLPDGTITEEIPKEYRK
jgi:hypothetical protein